MNGTTPPDVTLSALEPTDRVVLATQKHRNQAQRAAEIEHRASDIAERARRDANEARRLYEAELHSLDPRAKRRGLFPLAVVSAIALAFVDFVPAWYAAEALGGEMGATAVMSVLLVAALAGFAALLGYFEHDENRAGLVVTVGLLAALILVETVLRYEYLVVVGGEDWLRAGLSAGLLGIVTSGLAGISYVLLRRAEPIHLHRARKSLERAQRLATKLDERALRWERNRRDQQDALRLVTPGRPTPAIADPAEREGAS
jgi:hypothetical protein